MPPRSHVAVVGPGSGASRDECAVARDVGRLLAESDVVVITGGLGGVMAAAAQGCASAGGLSVGVLPGGDRTAANAYSTLTIPTGLGELRNGLVVRSADALIAVGGSWGTLSEIALARRCAVPVVCIGGWSVADASGARLELETAGSAQDAVSQVLDLIGPAPPP